MQFHITTQPSPGGRLKFTEGKVILPDHDADVIIEFPGGKQLCIQARPSNADTNYNGSLDLILPEDMGTVCWKGDDMEPAEITGECEVKAKQFVWELPGEYE